MCTYHTSKVFLCSAVAFSQSLNKTSAPSLKVSLFSVSLLLSPPLSLPHLALYCGFVWDSAVPLLKHSLSGQITVVCCLTLYRELHGKPKSGTISFSSLWFFAWFHIQHFVRLAQTGLKPQTWELSPHFQMYSHVISQRLCLEEKKCLKKCLVTKFKYPSERKRFPQIAWFSFQLLVSTCFKVLYLLYRISLLWHPGFLYCWGVSASM